MPENRDTGPTETLTRGDGNQYLSFLLGGEQYGVPLLKVREIIEYRAITPVPMTPDWLLGVLNLRGSVVPVVDLCLRFALETQPLDKRTCIVIVETESWDETIAVGLRVDRVQEVIFLEGGLKPTPELSGRPELDAIQGIASVHDTFVLIIDCDKALGQEALNVSRDLEGKGALSAPGC